MQRMPEVSSASASSPSGIRVNPVPFDDRRIMGNILEVYQVRHALLSDVDLLNLTILDFEPKQGWLTGRVTSPSMHEAIPFLVELPPGYPSREPPRFFFPKHQSNKVLENLKQSVLEFAVLYQSNKRAERRCLEDCMVFVAKALMNSPFTPGQMQMSVSFGDLRDQSITTSSVLLQASGLLASSGTTKQLQSTSQNDLTGSFSSSVINFPSQHASPTRVLRSNVPSLASMVVVAPLSLDEGNDMYDDLYQPRKVSATLLGEPSVAKVLFNENTASNRNMDAPSAPKTPPPLPSRTSHCGASFSHNGLLVVFTSSATSHRTSSAALSDGPGLDSIDDGSVVHRVVSGEWNSATNDSSSEDAKTAPSSLMGGFGNQRRGERGPASSFSLIQIGGGFGAIEDRHEAYWLPMYNPFDKLNASRALTRLGKLAWDLAENPTSNALVERSLMRTVARLSELGDAATLAGLYARSKLLSPDSGLGVVLSKQPQKALNSYARGYCDQLNRAGCFTQRCLIEKALEQTTRAHRSPSPPGVDSTAPSTFLWKKRVICSLCRVQCTSAVILCFTCDHGGHVSCMETWFAENGEDMCPAACGCRCSNPSLMSNGNAGPTTVSHIAPNVTSPSV